MNLSGPYTITIEANQKKSIELDESLDLSGVQRHKHIQSGRSSNNNLKIIDDDTERIL
ncbi:hypothetical protein [Halobacillus locisalis]|uniref:hypothetical protein n=1 Tax=Halobacillus locisalis TaxID=220753 RepID=UPI001FE4C5A1|nr:hypothetical protein [Halobacillus locisalis]